jgi:hypothetical protein
MCIVPRQMEPVTDWLENQRALWTKRLDQLDAYLGDLEDRT